MRPVEYASIPFVAAFVGITTNWMGVKMLFYPIEYTGLDWKRWPDTPYGLFGWQGVVPTKTEQMAGRLVRVITDRLLSLDEAFGRLDPQHLATLLNPAVQQQIRNDCGPYWALVLQPILPQLLRHLLHKLQHKDEIDACLNLEFIVLSAFVRDKDVLVDVSARLRLFNTFYIQKCLHNSCSYKIKYISRVVCSSFKKSVVLSWNSW